MSCRVIPYAFVLMSSFLAPAGLAQVQFTDFGTRLLPIDAVPDVTNVQVQVLTATPSLGPIEVEQYITVPVETVMSGLPRVEQVTAFRGSVCRR